MPSQDLSFISNYTCNYLNLLYPVLFLQRSQKNFVDYAEKAQSDWVAIFETFHVCKILRTLIVRDLPMFLMSDWYLRADASMLLFYKKVGMD